MPQRSRPATATNASAQPPARNYSYWVWGGRGGPWRPYDKDVSMALMRLSKAHAALPNLVGPILTVTIAGGGSFAIDIVNLTQRNLSTGAVRPIMCVRGPQSRAVPVVSPASSAPSAATLLAVPLFSLRLEDRKYPLMVLRAIASGMNVPPGCEWLFHETNEQAAGAILKGSMARGSGGAAGGGIYFAQTPALARQKAHNHGVMLKCLVYLGNIRVINTQDDAVRGLTFSELRQQGFDAARLTFLSGDEYVVYNRDQVLVVERC